MTLAFIVNAFENPMELNCCLASLKLQWKSAAFDVQIHVADNSKDATSIEQVCAEYNVNYHKTRGDCYTGSEQVARVMEGVDYLCFASSDGYYVPGFSVIMMEVVVRLDSDLVYCNTLYDPRLHGRGIYSVLDTVPEMRWIDKTSFIVRASCFYGWPAHKEQWRDGQFVEDLAKAGGKVHKAKGVLVVHN